MSALTVFLSETDSPPPPQLFLPDRNTLLCFSPVLVVWELYEGCELFKRKSHPRQLGRFPYLLSLLSRQVSTFSFSPLSVNTKKSFSPLKKKKKEGEKRGKKYSKESYMFLLVKDELLYMAKCIWLFCVNHKPAYMAEVCKISLRYFS